MARRKIIGPVAPKRSESGAVRLHQLNVENSTGERKGFWDTFRPERGYEAVQVVDLHQRNSRGEWSYARDIPTTWDALQIWNLAVQEGVPPTDFIMRTRGASREQARHALEYQANQVAYATGRKKFIRKEGGGYEERAVTEGAKRTGIRGITPKMAEDLVGTRELLSDHLREEKVLRAGQRAYAIVHRDGRVDPDSKRNLAGYGTWRDDPRFPSGYGSQRRQAGDETYSDDAADEGQAVDVFLYVMDVPDYPDDLQSLSDAKPEIANTNRQMGVRLSRIHEMKGNLANELKGLGDATRRGFKRGKRKK